MKYVEQFDLPCFPNAEPKEGCRTICGIEDRRTSGDTMPYDESKPFHCWLGGGGIGADATLEAARERLHSYVRRDLLRKIDEAQRQVEYYDNLVGQWGGDERYMIRFETTLGPAAHR